MSKALTFLCYQETNLQPRGHLLTAWQCGRCSTRSSRTPMAKIGSHAAVTWSNNSHSYNRCGLQNSERPSKRQKLDSNLSNAEQSITTLRDVSASNTKQISPFAPSRPRPSSIEREVTKSCESVLRPAVASHVGNCPDAPIGSGTAQWSHDGSDIDTILMDRLSELAAVDTRLTYLLERMATGMLSNEENDEYTAYCTSLTTDITWSIDSWRTRASTDIITPQSLPETGVVAPKQMNLPYQPQPMSTASYDRLSIENSPPCNPVKTPKTDSHGTGVIRVSDRTIIQSVEEPDAKINNRYENTCRKCFRDIPMAQKDLSGIGFW